METVDGDFMWFRSAADQFFGIETDHMHEKLAVGEWLGVRYRNGRGAIEGWILPVDFPVRNPNIDHTHTENDLTNSRVL